METEAGRLSLRHWTRCSTAAQSSSLIDALSGFATTPPDHRAVPRYHRYELALT
jgi:hypothetical protein